MTSNVTQQAEYWFALSPGLKLTITFVETTNVTITVKDASTISGASLPVPIPTTNADGYPQIVYGSDTDTSTTYPVLKLEIAGTTESAANWLQTELKVKNGAPTGSEPTTAQAIVGIIPAQQTWAYLENEKHRNWLNPNSGNRNFIAISPPQHAGRLHQYQELNPDMVSLVDVYTPAANMNVKNPAPNFLFRGNEPLTIPAVNDGPQTVDFEGLHSIFTTRYHEATGKQFPSSMSDYCFHDVCLRDPKRDNHQETHAFDPSKSTPLEPTASTLTTTYEENMWLTSSHAPNGAKMCWWPVNPSGAPYDDTNFLFQLDKWAGKTLVNLMNTPHDKPHVYYIHCANGHDRTGLVAYSYFVERGVPPEKAYILGSTVCLSQQNSTACTAITWDLSPKAGSPNSTSKTRIFPGGGSGPYFDTMVNMASDTGSMTWGQDTYVDKKPYGVFDEPHFKS